MRQRVYRVDPLSGDARVQGCSVQPGPLWATIDYGDRKSYSTAGTDKVKTKVFWHTYRKPGTFHVKVTI